MLLDVASCMDAFRLICLTRIKNYVKKTKTYSDSGAILSSTAAKYNAHIGDADSGVNGEH